MSMGHDPRETQKEGRASATTAARSGNTLLIQNDLGTTDAHVLVVRITDTTWVVTHTDIQLQRLRFFHSLLEETGIR
jgi:hypothetical protein